jgi:hypothetical protein
MFGGKNMTTDATTLQRLRALTHLYEQGYRDAIIDLTVKKLVESQVQQDEMKLAELIDELDQYEKRYGIPSQDFQEQFEAGTMGDDADVFEWHILYKMYLRLKQKTEALKAQL